MSERLHCVDCARGFWRLCKRGRKLGHSCLPVAPEPVAESDETLMDKFKEHISNGQPKENKHGGTAASLKDPKSTGRKRAAKLYPLDKEQPCEWAGKKNCGGGRIPIVGCLNGLQVARHHGPVKNTTRNHLGNVHRICTRCHNHWHELNDLIYNEMDYALLPHDPIDASIEEIAQEEIEWATGAKGEKFQLASSVTARKDYNDDENLD